MIYRRTRNCLSYDSTTPFICICDYCDLHRSRTARSIAIVSYNHVISARGWYQSCVKVISRASVKVTVSHWLWTRPGCTAHVNRWCFSGRWYSTVQTLFTGWTAQTVYVLSDNVQQWYTMKYRTVQKWFDGFMAFTAYVSKNDVFAVNGIQYRVNMIHWKFRKFLIVESPQTYMSGVGKKGRSGSRLSCLAEGRQPGCVPMSTTNCAKSAILHVNPVGLPRQYPLQTPSTDEPMGITCIVLLLRLFTNQSTERWLQKLLLILV